MTQPLVQARDLRITFDTPAGPLRAVNGVDLDIQPGEIYALVGEVAGKSGDVIWHDKGEQAPQLINAGAKPYRTLVIALQ